MPEDHVLRALDCQGDHQHLADANDSGSRGHAPIDVTQRNPESATDGVHPSAGSQVVGMGGISFVLPACNEASHIASTLLDIYDQVALHVRPFELILVDDGSQDGTFERFTEFAAGHPEARVIRNPKNLGLGCSIRIGFAAATQDYVMFVPTNGMLDPRTVFCDLADRSPDTAILFNPINLKLRPLYRRAISRAYNTMTTAFFRLEGVEYVHAILLLPRERVRLADLHSDRSFLVFELLISP